MQIDDVSGFVDPFEDDRDGVEVDTYGDEPDVTIETIDATLILDVPELD